LAHLLLRRSEAGEPALLWGREAKPLYGPAFDRLIARGVLVARAPPREWQVCDDCRCGQDWRPIARVDGQHVAICPLDRVSDLLLEAEDLESYEIDAAALVREIATSSGFADEPSEVIAGVWHLGRTATDRQVFAVLSRAVLVQSGLVGAIRMLDRSSQATLIAPLLSAPERLRFAEADIHVADSEECIGGTGRGAFAIDPAKLEPPQALTPRLVITGATHRVVLDNIEKHVPQQPFNLLKMLAEKTLTGVGFIPTHDIEAANSGRAASDLVRELRDCLAAGAPEPEQIRRLIKNRRSPAGYALALAAHEVELRP
jgi:hypothetical protein